MKIISFYNCKGGVGKTSLTYISGLFLSSQNKKVLLVDLDPQESLSSTFLSRDNLPPSILDYLMDKSKMKDLVIDISENLSFIPSNIGLLKVQNTVLQNKLLNGFKTLKEFDYIILDNAPTFNSLVISAIFASDQIIIPTLASLYDIREIDFVINEVNSIKPKTKINIVLNRVQNPNKISKDEKGYLDYLVKDYEKFLLETRIGNSTLIRKIIDRSESVEGKSSTKEKFRLNFLSFLESII